MVTKYHQQTLTFSSGLVTELVLEKAKKAYSHLGSVLKRFSEAPWQTLSYVALLHISLLLPTK